MIAQGRGHYAIVVQAHPADEMGGRYPIDEAIEVDESEEIVLFYTRPK